MKDDSEKNNSLIPIKNDYDFYNIYHEKISSDKKVNLLLKKSFNIDKTNLFSSINKKEKGLNIFRKMELPKLNLKFQREAKFHHLSIKIPSSGFKAKKLITREQNNKRDKFFTINNIVFNEDNSFKKNSFENIPSIKRYITLKKKNNINKRIINKVYEKDMMEFKIYSLNMNDIITEEMLKEFFRRLFKYKNLQFNDLIMNYIQTIDIFNISEEIKISNNDINNEINEEEIKNEKIDNNLIIHNVFFEWILTRVFENYINNLKQSAKNISAKGIKNLIINEIKNLSKLFFHKKYEKINKIINMKSITEKPINNNENDKECENLEDLLEIKKLNIQRELMEKIKEKIATNNNNSINDLSIIINYPKSVSTRNKRYRDMILSKNIINLKKEIKSLTNNKISNLNINNQNENNSELANFGKNISLNKQKETENKNGEKQKVSTETNTYTTLVKKYKNRNNIYTNEKHPESENNDSKFGLYDPYYIYEGIDLQSDIPEISINQIKAKKNSINIENNESHDKSEINNSISKNISSTENYNLFNANKLVDEKTINDIISISNSSLNQNNILEKGSYEVASANQVQKNDFYNDNKRSEKINMKGIKPKISNNDTKKNLKKFKINNEKNFVDINSDNEIINNIHSNRKNQMEIVNKIKKIKFSSQGKSIKRKKYRNKKRGKLINVNDDENLEENWENEQEGDEDEDNEINTVIENEKEGYESEEEKDEEEEKEEEFEDGEEEENKEEINRTKEMKQKSTLIKSSQNANNKKRKITKIINKKEKEKNIIKNNSNNSLTNIKTKQKNDSQDSINKKSNIQKKNKIQNQNQKTQEEETEKINKNNEIIEPSKYDEINNNIRSVEQNDKFKGMKEDNKEIKYQKDLIKIEGNSKLISENNDDNNFIDKSQILLEKNDIKKNEEKNQNKKRKTKKIKPKIKKDINIKEKNSNEVNSKSANSINDDNLSQDNESLGEEDEETEEDFENEEEDEENGENNNKKESNNKKRKKYDSDDNSSYFDNNSQNEPEKEEKASDKNNNKDYNINRIDKKEKTNKKERKTKKKSLIYDNSSKPKIKKEFNRLDTKKEVLDILNSHYEKNIENFEKVLDIMDKIPKEKKLDSDEEIEKKRIRIKHKKPKMKRNLPKLTDTSRGAFEQFTKEQEMKKEKKRKEDMLEREKIKKYFVDLKILKQLNDEGFDNYVNDKFDRLKDIKTNNDIKLRKENFIFNIFKDIEKDRKKSKKFNFISPVKFSNHNYNYY